MTATVEAKAKGVPLLNIANALQGIIPSTIGTCAPDDGTPNVTILSMVHYVDDNHVALTRQFFNKSAKNLAVNPAACALVYDPTDGQGYRLHLRYLRSETEGPTFDAMATRLAAIAAHMKLTDVFRLRSADIFEVQEVERVDGEVDTSIPLGAEYPVRSSEDDPERAHAMSLAELRVVHSITSRVSAANDLDDVLAYLLRDLAQLPELTHTSLLLADETGERLFTIASHGYDASGVGAEVMLGEGIIGTSAKDRRVVRVTNLDREIHYVRNLERKPSLAAMEIPLPSLNSVRSIMAVPMTSGEELLGVFAAQSTNYGAYSEQHETILGIVANQLAMKIRELRAKRDLLESPSSQETTRSLGLLNRRSVASTRRKIAFDQRAETILVDGEYLVRSVPAKILWKVLSEHRASGRLEFSNRELRTDASLDLPPIKDNLETRLILLRRRLKEKCPEIRLVQCGRGRFRLELDTAIDLTQI